MARKYTLGEDAYFRGAVHVGSTAFGGSVHVPSGYELEVEEQFHSGSYIIKVKAPDGELAHVVTKTALHQTNFNYAQELVNTMVATLKDNRMKKIVSALTPTFSDDTLDAFRKQILNGGVNTGVKGPKPTKIVTDEMANADELLLYQQLLAAILFEYGSPIILSDNQLVNVALGSDIKVETVDLADGSVKVTLEALTEQGHRIIVEKFELPEPSPGMRRKRRPRATRGKKKHE